MQRLAIALYLGQPSLCQPAVSRIAPMRLNLVLAAAIVCASMHAGAAPLDDAIKAKTAGFHGHVSLYAKNLDSGAVYGFAPDEPVRTASTIKLPIMIECFSEAAEGKLDMSEMISLPEDEKVSGSGILQDLSTGDRLPVRDLMLLMIVLSDNTATNLILNRIGGNAVNARMAQLGLVQTRVMRKILGKGAAAGITEEGAKPENKKWGLGRTSPREMISLLERLYRGELVSKSASSDMLAILKKQRDHAGLARDVKDVTVANKSGALDALRSDVGIVYSKRGPIAIAITADGIPEPDWSPDNPGQLLISELSELLIQQL
jgi:beta-lactamase class A